MEKGIYVHPCRLYFNDFDMNGRIRMSSVLHFLSDVAGIAYASYGSDREWLLQHEQVFLLSQFRIEFSKMPHSQENAKMEIMTWETGSKGATFVRNFRITDEDNEQIALACSTWLLVDPKEHKILRPKDLAGETCPIELEYKPELPQKLRFDPEKLVYTEHSSYAVRYSDIDLNRHVYNAKYADMICNALPEEYMEKVPAEFQIQYKQEAKLGDVLHIGYEEDQDGVTAVGTLENKTVSFIAKITFREDTTQ